LIGLLPSRKADIVTSRCRGSPFKSELKIFGDEANAAAQFLYGSLAVGTLINEDPNVRKRLNIAPLFWNTVHFSLQKSAILALGRIFETNTAHNAARLMREAGQIDIFSKDALRRRKHEQSANAAEWIEEFLARAYVPSHDDIRRLRKEVDTWRKIYDANYRPLRDKTFAHSEFAQGHRGAARADRADSDRRAQAHVPLFDRAQ
jgi:hypothetical protein